MGSKYRPIVSCTDQVMDQAAQDSILAILQRPIEKFAKAAEDRICMPNSMQEWVGTVMSELLAALHDIPDGTLLQPPDALPYTHDDDIAMRRFLTSYKGSGVVCTSMDKAETTLMFMCPKLYVDKLLTDLETGGTYRLSEMHETPAACDH